MNQLVSLWDAEAEQPTSPDFASTEAELSEPASNPAVEAPLPVPLERRLRIGPALLALYSFGGVMFFGLSALALDTVIQLAK